MRRTRPAIWSSSPKTSIGCGFINSDIAMTPFHVIGAAWAAAIGRVVVGAADWAFEQPSGWLAVPGDHLDRKRAGRIPVAASTAREDGGHDAALAVALVVGCPGRAVGRETGGVLTARSEEH